MKTNIFDLFINKILKFPFPLKQLLYMKLWEEMKDYSSKTCFVSYVPSMTFKGKTELENKTCGFDNNIYRFLQFCAEDMSMLEISINTFLSLEETAKYFEFCLEQGFIEKPDSNKMLAVIGFIAGKYRTGEYFKQLGEINDSDIEKALNLCSDTKRIGESLLELGVICENDLNQILLLKNDAKKRYVLDCNKLPDVQVSFSGEKSELEIENLKNENYKLKRKIQQILKLVKKDEL